MVKKLIPASLSAAVISLAIGVTPAAVELPAAAAHAAGGGVVKVMTYNILRLTKDGTSKDGGTIAPWSKRRVKAAALVNGRKPDVIAVQEAGSLLPGTQKRQVESFVSAIGGGYRLAYTEIPPKEANSTHLGVYIVYNSATVAPVRRGFHFSLGQDKYGAYDLLKLRATGTRFLMVSTHLSTGPGLSYDQLREQQASTLISKSENYAGNHGDVPIIYAGDFNSYNDPRGENSEHPLDGPGIAMKRAGNTDAFEVATKRVRAEYNSDNHYRRQPPQSGLSVDHIYASAGVTLRSWIGVLRLRNGEFVGVIPSDHNPVVSAAALP